jgi:hypothetical protein
VGATTVTDMWVRMTYLQFSRIIMAWFKLSLLGRVRVRGVDGYLLDTECILAIYFSSNGLGKMLF